MYIICLVCTGGGTLKQSTGSTYAVLEIDKDYVHDMFSVYCGLYTEAEYRQYIARPGDRDNVHYIFSVYWGLYTEAEYRQYIARPGDRDNVHYMFSVYWGLYTEAEYRQYIARPGDGDRDYVHDMNFNKAQGKMAEALQVGIFHYHFYNSTVLLSFQIVYHVKLTE